MDNNTPTTPSVTPPISPPPTPQPTTPPAQPVLNTSSSESSAPVSNLTASPSVTPPATPPASNPFPLKWALLGIGIIVVLAGSILGILGANKARNSAQTTETRAAAPASATVENAIVKWPYGSLPNVMMEKNTLRVVQDEDTGTLSIHGNIIFAKMLLQASPTL